MARKRANPNGKRPVPSYATLTEDELVALVRDKAETYLRIPNVTSVGVGHCIDKATKKPTAELCIQFTVDRKLSPEALAAEAIAPLPDSLEDDAGRKVRVQVLERSYKASFVMMDEESVAESTPAQLRRQRLSPMAPGASIGNIRDRGAGTFGAIVYDTATGSPLILSNWHVLHTPAGQLGDRIIQPGYYDDPNVSTNAVGQLLRSHLGLAGDCAVASISAREAVDRIMELEQTPKRIAKASLNDKVVKSGRTTGVTYGVVRRVGVVVALGYGGGVSAQIGGFEIGPDPQRPADDGEVSKGGDSGSCWLLNVDGHRDVVVGLHFAGESDPAPEEEHAVACNIHSVLEKLQVTFKRPAPESLASGQIDASMNLLAQLAARVASLEQAKSACGCVSQASSPAARQSIAESGLPVYGNWCGPGHGGGEPIDDLDRACMNHDNCYGQKGYFDCGCDRSLQRDIAAALAHGNVQPQGRVLAPAIAAWFAMQPCTNHVGPIPIPTPPLPPLPFPIPPLPFPFPRPRFPFRRPQMTADAVASSAKHRVRPANGTRVS